jgi:hypothetical protein
MKLFIRIAIIVALLIITEALKAQSYNVYQIEYGTYCDGNRHRDSLIRVNDEITLTDLDVTVYGNYKRYHFFEDTNMGWIDEYIYSSQAKFIDHNLEVGILTYWYNRFVGTRLIHVEYKDNYYRYYFK